MFSVTGYWPRVATYDGRAIEQALAGSSLLDEVPRLQGAVVEATYARGDPPILQRLREALVRLQSAAELNV